MRGCQQAVDQLCPGIRRLVIEKLSRFRGRRRQSDQIEISTPQQSCAIRPGSVCDGLLLKRAENERVDRIHRTGWNRWSNWQPERPVIALLRADRIVLSDIGFRGCDDNTGVPYGALPDPQADRFHLFRRYLRAQRHRRFFQSRNHAEQPALLRIAGNNCRTVLAAFQRQIARSEAELRKLHTCAVAVPAGFLKDRLNVPGK